MNGTYLAIWLAHTGFGLPLAIYLLYNYISQLPREILAWASVYGASHFTIFTQLIVPLSVPVIALYARSSRCLWATHAFALALISASRVPGVMMKKRPLKSSGRGVIIGLTDSGAFISMILPLTVFVTLQRYFVRGLTAGSVKG